MEPRFSRISRCKFVWRTHEPGRQGCCTHTSPLPTPRGLALSVTGRWGAIIASRLHSARPPLAPGWFLEFSDSVCLMDAYVCYSHIESVHNIDSILHWKRHVYFLFFDNFHASCDNCKTQTWISKGCGLFFVAVDSHPAAILTLQKKWCTLKWVADTYMTYV